MANLLILDDDRLFCEALGTTLEEQGHRVLMAHTLARARELLQKHVFAVVFIDVYLPDGNGIDLMNDLSQLPDAPEAIVVMAQGNPDGAETVIVAGAWDYIQKPAHMVEIVLMVERALEAHERKRQLPDLAGSAGIVGTSRPMRLALMQMLEAAQSDSPVLISGETGTGKELLARAIHKNSRRARGPFVVVDCGAIVPTLLESELFGNVRGAFTGAVHARHGLVMLANQGTLFLGEVGELSQDQQKVFLRLLQERSFRPIGGTEEVQSDFRVVAATNRNLAEMAAGGTFRTDLLFRLQGMTIQVPPLRSRNEDIPALAQYARVRSLAHYGMQSKIFSQDALKALSSYTWPGNVRELLHTVEAAVLAASDQQLVLLQHLPVHLRASAVRSRVNEREKQLLRGQAEPVQATKTPGGTQLPETEDSPQEPPVSGLYGAPRENHAETPGADQILQKAASPAFNVSGSQKPAPSPGINSPGETSMPVSWREFHETTLHEHKRRYLLSLLQWSGGNVPAAAEAAGLSRQRLYILLREHGIARQWE